LRSDMQVTDDDRVHFTPGDKDRIEKETFKTMQF
jgi:hypothetical protein